MIIEGELDRIGRSILATLQREGRIPFSELGRRVGLSAPSVAERVRRMEDLGLITGYRATVDRERLGWRLTAFMRVTCPGDKYQAVRRLALDLPEVIDCHHVTGEDCFFLKIAVSSVDHLEQVIDRFRAFGRTVSSVALSTTVEDKPPAVPERRNR
ncbi:MAG TPA: Lrp/AsnC family transcriptional regulator [Chromatiales bacterium]|nr:Lrp/AsnC family transcriptional regulator [Chromatiales bacterium]